MRYPLLPQPPSVYASIVDRDPKHDGIHTSLSLPGASHSRMSCVIQQSLDQCLPVFSSEEEQQLTSGPDELHLHSHLHSRLAICHPNSNHPPQPPSVYASTTYLILMNVLPSTNHATHRYERKQVSHSQHQPSEVYVAIN